ncbi:MAG: type II toxin-antitoxin system RelE/ParE family toxin [Pirellulales bacterium]|nr:type II toxin-antitoxin system RelE/ParE family toxin [Pirellulales bacterium]
MAPVRISPEALKQAEALNEPILTRVMSLAERLKKWPHISGAKPLTGNLSGHYRLRTGDYRLQFRVEGDTVVVEKIGHRDRFYDD